jgi:hypothetical protein
MKILQKKPASASCHYVFCFDFDGFDDEKNRVCQLKYIEPSILSSLSAGDAAQMGVQWKTVELSFPPNTLANAIPSIGGYFRSMQVGGRIFLLGGCNSKVN